MNHVLCVSRLITCTFVFKCVWQCQQAPITWVTGNIQQINLKQKKSLKEKSCNSYHSHWNCTFPFLKSTSLAPVTTSLLYLHFSAWHWPTVVNQDKAKRFHWMWRQKSLPAGLSAGNRVKEGGGEWERIPLLQRNKSAEAPWHRYFAT